MDPFLGEVRMFTWGWAPRGWALCDGAMMSTQQNVGLYALLGVTFGGTADLKNFKLPDLRGRTPICIGVGQDRGVYRAGDVGGVEGVTLTTANLPPHTHQVNAFAGTAKNIKGNSSQPKSALPATVGLSPNSTNTAINIYAAPGAGPAIALNGATFSTVGGGAAHNNMQPFLVMNFCIATQGLFPPRQ